MKYIFYFILMRRFCLPNSKLHVVNSECNVVILNLILTIYNSVV
jgi:hypothetical protein